MKKKIILFGLMLVMGFVLGLVSVQAVYVSGAVGCGPSLPPVWCQTTANCGTKNCVALYEAMDSVASQKCSADYALCQVPKPTGFCGGDALYTCSSSAGSVSNCNAEACKLQCSALPIAQYVTAESAAEAEAFGWATNIMSAGVFESNLVPCSEMNSCFLKIGTNLVSFDRLACEGIQPQTIADVIAKFCTSPSSCTKIGEFIRLDSLTQQVVWDAAAKYGLETPILKQIAANAIMLGKNAWGFLDPILNNPLVKLASFAKTAFDLVKSFTGGAEQAASDSANTIAAKKDINDADNSKPDGTATLSDCKNHRLDDCVNHPSCVVDNREGALQCLAALPGGKDERVKVTFGSLHVIDNRLNNMFTLTGKQNQGVVYQKDGFVNIDKGGTTKISVAGIGAFITDVKNNQLYIGPGTTFYYGKGGSEEDTYITNTMILDYDSRIGVADVNAKEQQRYPENAKKSLKQNIELAVTFNQHGLQKYKNAINIEKSKENYEILTRGFSDILLLEEEKVFPLVTRNFAKGDASIIMHRNVKIPNTYIVNDETYEYTIKTIDDSTKVITKNGKVIEDSGSFDTRLSRRQNILVNNI